MTTVSDDVPGATVIVEAQGVPVAAGLQTPIVAVTVFPSQARVTRRATVRLSSGTHELRFVGLPLDLDPESVRVSGRGPARVLGVDIGTQSQPELPHEAIAELQALRARLRGQLDVLRDGEEAQDARRAFLDTAARTAASAFARVLAAGETPADALATGSGDAGRLVAAADLLGEQIAATLAGRRAISAERDSVERQLDAVERDLARRPEHRQPDRRTVTVSLEVDPVPTGPAVRPTDPVGTGSDAGGSGLSGPGSADVGVVDVELDLSYLVGSASWTSVYDARLEGQRQRDHRSFALPEAGVPGSLDGDRVTLTWYGMVSQQTGEDWPACELTLSTARPAAGASLPELPPWFVDVRRYSPAVPPRFAAGPPQPPSPAAAPSPARGGAQAPEAGFLPLAAAVADVDHGPAAATYRLARAVPVPADGAPHRTTVALFDWEATLDHLTVPKLAQEAYLRATITNTSDHTLLPGRMSVFHGADFVGSTSVGTVAPGAEVKLHLGLDDRLVVERELVRRTTGKKMVGSTRRTEMVYRISLANHTPRVVRISVQDQYPVARHEDIVIRDEHASPEPDERTDLGVLTWRFELKPGSSKDIAFSFRLDCPRGIDLSGWFD